MGGVLPLAAVLAAACGAAVAGCDLPTRIPSWDVGVRVLTIRDSIAVPDYRPASAHLEAGRFVFPDGSSGLRVEARSHCPECVRSPGRRGRYPAFEEVTTAPVELGEEFVSAELVGGTLRVVATHDFPYTLLRSDEGETGSIVLRLVDGRTGDVLVSETVTGAEDPFSPGGDAPLVLEVPLAGVTVTPDVHAELAIHSPGSGADTLRILDPARAVEATISVTGLAARSVTVQRPAVRFEGPAYRVEVDEAVRDKASDAILRATARVTVEQPFAVAGELVLGFFASESSATREDGRPVTAKAVSLAQGTVEADLTLSDEEVRSLLAGPEFFIRPAGQLEEGIVTVRATDRIRYRAILEFEVGVNR